jgi:radical SAM superfamily enzyme YgiQ (UPF0313 family)
MKRPSIYDIYEGTVFRPPSEANSLILQITIGCSYNRCTFCDTYGDKEFRIKTFEDLKHDVELVLPFYRHIDKIFLADGNALMLPTDQLVQSLEYLYEKFPNLKRVGVYGCPGDILKKSEEDLKLLNEKGLKIIYLGLESGSDKVLKRVKKGALSKHMIECANKVKASGILLSAIIILGLGGRDLSDEHGRETGRVLSKMDPDYIGGLTLMLLPGTPLYEEEKHGKFKLLNTLEIYPELRKIVENINVTNCIFRINHASNYVPIRGTLPEDKEEILKIIDHIIETGSDEFKPEWMRGL